MCQTAAVTDLREKAVQFLGGVIASLEDEVNLNLTEDNETRATVESAISAVAQCRDSFVEMDTLEQYEHDRRVGQLRAAMKELASRSAHADRSLSYQIGAILGYLHPPQITT